MREIFFLKNHTLNVVKKLVPNPFTKIKIEDLQNQQSEIFYSLLLLYV